MIQRLKSESLQPRYSVDEKVNSIIRTLVAFYGHSAIFSHVSDYIRSLEAKDLTAEQTWELYQAAKWAQYFKD